MPAFRTCAVDNRGRLRSPGPQRRISHFNCFANPLWQFRPEVLDRVDDLLRVGPSDFLRIVGRLRSPGERPGYFSIRTSTRIV